MSGWAMAGPSFSRREALHLLYHASGGPQAQELVYALSQAVGTPMDLSTLQQQSQVDLGSTQSSLTAAAVEQHDARDTLFELHRQASLRLEAAVSAIAKHEEGLDR